MGRPLAENSDLFKGIWSETVILLKGHSPQTVLCERLPVDNRFCFLESLWPTTKICLKGIWPITDFFERPLTENTYLFEGPLAERRYFVERPLAENSSFGERSPADDSNLFERVVAENIYFFKWSRVENTYFLKGFWSKVIICWKTCGRKHTFVSRLLAEHSYFFERPLGNNGISKDSENNTHTHMDHMSSSTDPN